MDKQLFQMAMFIILPQTIIYVYILVLILNEKNENYLNVNIM